MVKIRRKIKCVIIAVVVLTNCMGCEEKETTVQSVESQEVNESYEKGYDLPIPAEVKEESENECREIMRSVQDIYLGEEKTESENGVISEDAVQHMLEVIGSTGVVCTISEDHNGLKNYEEMEKFLDKAEQKKEGTLVLYDISFSGGITRKEFQSDGKDLYLLESVGIWDEEKESVITSTVYTRIKEWEYTKKGWLAFEYCVPEYPEVTEVIQGDVLLRVRPLDESYYDICNQYLTPLSYNGNNILSSNWNQNHIEGIDYNAAYQYLYEVEYKEDFKPEKYVDGIPMEDFEYLMTKYFPVTKDEVRQYAAYDEDRQVYLWVPLSCKNYKLHSFWTSFPEITDIRENEDGTVTIYVDAVCELQGSEAAMRHELKVQFTENGIRYLGNVIQEDGADQIPEYQYRIPTE